MTNRIFLAFTLAIFGLSSCASPELRAHRSELRALPQNLKRAELYKSFPPSGKPRPFPIFRTGSGTRGREAYPIDEIYAIEGSTHYWTAKGFKDVKPHPNDRFSQCKIVKRSDSAILNWSTTTIAEQSATAE